MRHSLARSRKMASVVDAVGDTPLVRLRHVAREAPSVEVYVKLEFANPGGSVKDRPALRMMTAALADGRLTADKILVDSTSGNTGVAYSLFGAALVSHEPARQVLAGARAALAEMRRVLTPEEP